MVNVDIHDELYERIKRIVRENKIRYPSVKFFVQKILLEELEAIGKDENELS